MNKLQVVEPMHSGHHTNYLLALVPGIEKLRDTGLLASAVFTITRRHFELLQDSGEIARIGPAVEWDPTLEATSPHPTLRERAALHRHVCAAVERQRPDALLCTTADYDLLPSAVRRFVPGRGHWPRRSAGMIHFGCPKGDLSAAENLKRIVYEATWKWSRWSRLLMVNPLAYEGLVDRGVGDPGRYGLLPDPVPEVPSLDRDAARDRLGLPREGTYVGCVGGMDPRKALPELIEGFVRADLGPTVRLVLAGRLDPSYRQLIDTRYAGEVRNGRFIVIDRVLSEAELLSGFAALDLHSALQYRRFNLSSNVLKCVAADRPFVCDEIGFGAMLARRFEAGVTCDVGDVASIGAALRAGIETPRSAAADAGAARLREFHSIANFARTALAAVLGPEVFDRLGPAATAARAYTRQPPASNLAQPARRPAVSPELAA